MGHLPWGISTGLGISTKRLSVVSFSAIRSLFLRLRRDYLRGQRELARWLDSVADTKGAPVTFGGKSVEKCVLVKKVDFEK